MKINNTNTPSFGAIKISNAKLREILPDGSISKIRATISELSPFEKADQDTFERMQPVWADTTEWFEDIYEFFSFKPKHKKFIAIEKDDVNLPIEKRIKSFIVFTNPKTPIDDTLVVSYLQSAPGIANRQNTPIKGAGALALFEAVVQAEKHQIGRIQLFSSNHKFYQHLGLEYKYPKGQYALGYFEMLKKDYASFIEKIQEKYDFTHD